MKAHYTTTETAQELATTVRTISRWLKTGVIAGTKQGIYWRISAAEVERMKAERQANPPPRKVPRFLPNDRKIQL